METPDTAAREGAGAGAAPLALHSETVRSEWIDYNGHMNVAYYMLAFDHATDAFYDHVGLGLDYRDRTNCSTFTLEAHITYERELREGAPLRFETLLLDFDSKRIHYFHRMFHGEDGYLAATNELIAIHVDLSARRATPMPDGIRASLDRLLAVHGRLPRPPQVGRIIGIRRRGDGGQR